MIKTFIFLLKYQILKDPINLSYHTKEFFELSKPNQRKVLDKYFNQLPKDFQISSYFDTKESRYYKENQELTFFHCYYFDKKIIEYDLTNIKLIDKFKISKEKITYLIEYSLQFIKENNLKLNIEDIILYPDNLPIELSKNLQFMTYLVEQDCYSIRYLTYNEECASRQRELIKNALSIAKTKEFNLKKFCKSDQTIPSILENNLDFNLYLIENNIENIDYLNEKLLDNLTISNQNTLIETIITSLTKNPNRINQIEENKELASILNKKESFINCIISLDLENIRYIDWHNLPDKTTKQIIDNITKKLTQTNTPFEIMKYPFRDLFFQNYSFMKYLITKDFRWIAITKVVSKEENEKLINLFFEIISSKKYKFKLEDFLEDGHSINHNLIENKKMLHYLFTHHVPIVQHTNFLNLKSTRTVVENLVNELEKTEPEYEFNNEEYLINGKYPMALSNNYRFMRYVIDKNFNHIAYIDTSMIDKRELKRIINYAFRMVYYIRGDNKKLNFDLKEPYFQNSDIIKEDYFQECLKSL